MLHLLFLLLFVPFYSAQSPPNVIVIVADDLGYDDVSWHDPVVLTPNLGGLAEHGIILEGHYVQPVCTPTRAALMTSYYPIHTGRQAGVLNPEEPIGLYTNFTLMAQYFKDIGYRTHAIGKWHLGFCHEDYLPTKRGFDTFHGFYLGSLGYYDHLREPSVGDKTPGYDFRTQDEVDYSANGTYSAILLVERAVQTIKDHAENHANTPMFMYLPFQNVHAPVQVPIEYEELYLNIESKTRRKHLGMVSVMDDMVGLVIEELKNNGLYDNTIIVFTSDNGAPSGHGGTNWPLRGTKHTWWEGGTRSAAFVYSKLFKNTKGTVNDNLIHVVDWLPTLLSAVKDKLSKENQKKVEQFLLEPRDGVDQWSMLLGDGQSQRSEFVYNINLNHKGYKGAIRIGDYKLSVGYPGDDDGHYPPANFTDYLRPSDFINDARLSKTSAPYMMMTTKFICSI